MQSKPLVCIRITDEGGKAAPVTPALNLVPGILTVPLSTEKEC